ncbi:hypothetical protein LQV63_16710 [Paenibacillus profundus]|uniref:Uncharacterized protein n=1 Tax=Paenibacillus profundus TaxID=1173085 RepID=A0ABS8YL04_9BACL|nr:hypothetical protein [Paenibacillus profundus]
MAVSRFTQSFTVRLDAHAAFYVQGKKSPGFLLALVNLAVSASAIFLLFWTEEALESAVMALFAFVGCDAASAAIFSEPNSRMPQLPPCSCFSCEKFSSPYSQGSAAARQCTRLRRLAICIRRLPIPAGQFELHLRLLLQLRQRLVH